MELCLIIDAVIAALDLFSVFYDIVAFLLSRENRKARKEAKRAGEAPPDKDRWTRRFHVLTVIVVVLTGYLVVRKIW